MFHDNGVMTTFALMHFLFLKGTIVIWAIVLGVFCMMFDVLFLYFIHFSIMYCSECVRLSDSVIEVPL